MMKFIIPIIISVLLISCLPNEDTSNIYNEIYSGIEFEMPKVKTPEFPDFSVNIIEFGAVSDGRTLNTKAIENAISNVSENGGGTVIIPRGIWLTGPIILKSNINLHAEAGALILFSGNFDLYPIVETSFEGLNTFRCTSPIYANGVENIAITGEGVFDGAGDLWRPVKKSKLTESKWAKQIAKGGVLNETETTWYPSEKALKGSGISNMNVPDKLKTKEEHETIKDFLRPVMVSIINSKRILIDGVGFQNSPAWCLHPLMCEDVTLINLTIRNPWYAQNGDGLDLESCKNVIIYNCNFDVGDDGICFKSGKDEDGLKRGMANENVIVKNCIVYHGHGGFVVGSEMSGGMKNIHVSNCTFMGTDIGIRFKSTRGRGGVIENIYISNIDMIDIPAEAIRFNMYYSGNSPIPEPEQTKVNKEELARIIPPVSRTTPVFKDIYMKNIVCKGAQRAIELEGLPEMNLENVFMEDINIKSKYGMDIKDVKGLKVKNLTLSVSEGPVIKMNNSKNIDINGFSYTGNYNRVLQIDGVLTQNIKFTKNDISEVKGNVAISGSVPEKEVIIY